MKLISNFFAASLVLLTAPTLVGAQTRISTDNTNFAAAANGGRVLSVTSVLDSDKEFDGKNLIDGQAYNAQTGAGTKGWASDRFDPINMESATFGFKDNVIRSLGKLVINSAAAVPPERWVKDLEVQVSTETAEGPYTAVTQITLRRAPGPQEFQLFPVDARFVRLMFRSNWGSDRAVALGEVEMYEAIDTKDPLGQVISRLENTIAELERYSKVQLDAPNAGGQMVATPAAAPRRAPLSAATVQMVQLMGGGTAALPVSNANIALSKNGGKIMAYSSVFDNDLSYGPNLLLDGDNFRMADGKGSNGWASQGFNPGKEFVTIGFKDDRTKLVGKLVLNPASNQQDLRWARRVDVQASTGSFRDGPFRTIATLNLRPEAVNQEFLIRPVETKYLRFIFMANGPGIDLPQGDPNINSDRAVSLGEIEVYEAVSTGDQLAAVISKFNGILNDLKRIHKSPEVLKSMAANEGATLAPAKLNNPPRSQSAPTTAAKAAPLKASKAVPVRGSSKAAKPKVISPRVDPKRRTQSQIAENLRRVVG